MLAVGAAPLVGVGGDRPGAGQAGQEPGVVGELLGEPQQVGGGAAAGEGGGEGLGA